MSGTIKYQFTGFTFSPNEYKLEDPIGKTVTLTPITCNLLRVFVENYGSILSVDDLIKEVWPGKIEEVENGNVIRQISFLRKALKQISKKSDHLVNIMRR